jgi:hypothetical protein
MKYKSFFRVFTLAAICMLPLHANAQETSASFAGGSVKLGDDNRACDGTTEGAIRYTAATNVVEFCNGTVWSAASGGGSAPCTIGDPVGEGICAGRYENQNLIAAPAGCNNGDTVAADCDGTDDLESWGYNGWGDLDNSYVDMVQANADYFTELGGVDPSLAAGSCAGLALDGEDWYLPTLAQLALIYENRNIGSWAGGGFSSDHYWTINIREANNALAIDFAGGAYFTVNSGFTNERFRCVRLQ